MRLRNCSTAPALFFVVILSLVTTSSVILAQQTSQNKPAAQQDDDVLRIRTELVQTDLMVFDKQGRFVEGLRPEQFELSLDGKPQAISFFERVSAGSTKEGAQIAAARSGTAQRSEPLEDAPSPERGRVVFFFLDDLHLSEASLTRARKALADFVENQMGQNDQIAVVSASGQIGFLQQLTDYKPMLREAINRLNYKRNNETFAGRTVITEYQANQMAEHGDRDLFNYIVTSTVNEFQLLAPKGGDSRGLDRLATNMVRNRNQQILAQSKAATAGTLSALEGLVRSSAGLPGRKLVFFISDGFLTDPRGAAYALDMLQRITATAARVGAVVYTMDARGTFSDPAVDAGRNDFPDGMAVGTAARNPSTEASAMREPLRILADETGGRAILSDNSFTDAFQQAINETSAYYLLAWRPDTDDERSGKSKIKVTIKDRPDLRVRLRRNYYVPPPTSAGAKSADEKRVASDSAPGKAETGLLTALGALYPQGMIPTALSVGYVNLPGQGQVLKLSMQIDRGALDAAAAGAKKAEVDVIGAAVDDRGSIVTFKQLLTVAPDPSLQNQPQYVVWNQQLKLQPGLYQVRVAVRERASGRTGGAQQWIEVPDVGSGRFQISSLFLGERKAVPGGEKFATTPRPVSVDVDHHFGRASIIRFQTYVYNAAHDRSAPDVEIQTRVLRGNRTVVTMPAVKLPTETMKDLAHLPYWAEIALDQLPPGKYLLHLTATDRATKASDSQQVSFVVE